ncbi:7343_t:CDS:2, partial [Entrophospora sp. SA101]
KVTQQENMLYKVNNDYRELKSLTNENNRLKEQLKAFQRENTFMNNPNASSLAIQKIENRNNDYNNTIKNINYQMSSDP